MLSGSGLGKLLRRSKNVIVALVGWLPTLTVLVIVGIVLLHKLYPPTVEWLGEIIGLPRPSLASVLTLVVSVFVLERLVHMEEVITRPPVSVHGSRVSAYQRVAEHVGTKGVQCIDLLQFSGFISLDLLRAVAERSPKAKVRLLLVEPAKAQLFDGDNQPNHADRISTVVAQIKIWERDYTGFKVDFRYYSSPAGVSAVMFDDAVCISWYNTFPDGSVVRMRGHMAPAIIASGDGAKSLRLFAAEQFKKIWDSASKPAVA